jgi:hypothetical protein
MFGRQLVMLLEEPLENVHESLSENRTAPA